MMIKKQWFPIGLVMVSAIGLFAPTTTVAQHGPTPHAAGSSQQQQGPGQHPGGATAAPYDVKTEVRLTGTVVHVNAVAHGSSATAAHDGTLMLKTDTGTVDVQLAPAAFLAEKKVKIAKGDTIEVFGSRVTSGDSQVLLARDIRKGSTSWTLRAASGAPLWAPAAHGQHR
jgi:DNA/RNA endonuclease YhcR with UshA esterase domain